MPDLESTENRQHSIMIVEDDPTIQHALSYLFRMEGYDVKEAENGRAALDHLRSGWRPHLILLDLMMPVMDGAEFVHELRQSPEISSIPVVVLSGDGRACEKATALGISESFEKPIRFERILEIAGKYCQ